MEQGLVTRARRAFDRALCSLPITQHDRIWQIYLVGACCLLGVTPAGLSEYFVARCPAAGGPGRQVVRDMRGTAVRVNQAMLAGAGPVMPGCVDGAAEVPDAARHPDRDGGARVQALPAPGAQPHRGVRRLPQVQGVHSPLVPSPACCWRWPSLHVKRERHCVSAHPGSFFRRPTLRYTCMK